MAKKAPAKKAAPKKPAKPPVDWVAVLRTGADGVKKWNKLTVAEREKVKLSGTNLSGADLSGVNFHGLVANEANFSDAKLVKAKLNGGSFKKAVFAKADLSDANLGYFEANGANFTAAILSRVSFCDSRLNGACFAEANLTDANLSKADLCVADLTGATTTNVVWDGTTFNQHTKWPANFPAPGEAHWAGRGTDPRLSGKGRNAVAADINGLMARLHKNIDEKRMKRTLDMLKKERNQIFSEVEPTMVRGIVKSQRDIDTVYSCVLTDDGTYSCCTPDMGQCMGLSNEPCKHLLVLLIGLAKAGQLDPTTADKWVVAANKKNPRWNKTVQGYMADSLLKYKGVQAGEIDWRPTETIPEDFYAM